MMTGAPDCYDCIHFIKPWICKAYPVPRTHEIPIGIVESTETHKYVRPDQVGAYTFVPKEKRLT